MLTPEDHTKLLRSFEVDRLLKLVTLEAKRLHDGHYTILAFTTGYKVAFGTPNISPGWAGKAYPQVQYMPSFPTLKEALIAALVTGKDFEDYFDGNPEAWWAYHLASPADFPGEELAGLVDARDHLLNQILATKKGSAAEQRLAQRYPRLYPRLLPGELQGRS